MWGTMIAAVLAFIAIAFLVTSPSSWQGAKVAPRAASWIGLLSMLDAGSDIFCIGLLKRNATEMAVTNKRVIVSRARKSADHRTSLARIESIASRSLRWEGSWVRNVIVRGTGGRPRFFRRLPGPWNSESKSSARSLENQNAPERLSSCAV